MIRSLAASATPKAVPGQRLLTNTVVQFATPGLRAVVGLLLAAALSRYLGVAGFGQYALVFAYVAVFSGVFADWGLGTVCLREISRHPERRASLIATCAAMQGVIALVTYLVLLTSLLLVPYPAAVRLSIALYGLTILMTPLDLFGLPLQADLRVARLLPASVGGTLVNFVLVMGAIAIGAPLAVLVCGSLLSLVIQYGWVTHLGVQALRGGVLLPAWPDARGLLREAWPLALSTVVATGLQQAPLLALSLWSLEAVGTFNAANKIPQQLFMLPIAIRTTTFPLLSGSWITDRQRFRRQLDRLLRASVVVSVPLSILGIGLAGPMMHVIFGPRFLGASIPFILLLAAFALMFPGILLGEALIAAGFQRLSLLINAASLPLLLILLDLFIPAGGASGAALALLCSEAGMVAAVSIAGSRRLGLTGLGRTASRSAAGLTVGLFTMILCLGAGTLLASIAGTLAALATLGLFELSGLRSLTSPSQATRDRNDVMVGDRPTLLATVSRVDPRRVALVYPIPFGDGGVFGGGERYAIDLAAAMSRRVDTVLVTFGTSRRTEHHGRLTIEQHPWITLVRGLRQNPLSFAFVGSLRTTDVIHCLTYHTLPTDVSVLFGRVTGKRVFITDVGGGGDVSLARLFDVTRMAHSLLLISDRATRDFPGGQRSRHVIYAGVDAERFAAGPDQRERRVLYVGRLLPHKGINYLLDAVDETIPVTIAGRPYHGRYFELLKAKAVGKNVTFITDADDPQVVRLYQRCAVSVLPSVHQTVYGDYARVPELLGFTLMEAMACATPVICTDAGSLSEVVTDGVDGFVVPPNQPEALRQRIDTLLADPARARAMGARARQTIIQKFTWDQVVDRCLTAYSEAAA